ITKDSQGDKMSAVFEIQAINEKYSYPTKPSWTNRAGKEMFSYQLAGHVDGSVESSVEMNFARPENCPKVGDIIAIDIKSNDTYGIKASKSHDQSSVAPK